ncbi:MAG: hypothetical protein WBA28_05440 [Microbacteriaceae bacterium]
MGSRGTLEQQNLQELEDEKLLTVWTTVSARRAGYDTLMWQAPVIGMTAQAFLMTSALDRAHPDFVRVFFCVLSLLVAVIVIQFFVKNRRNEMLDSFLLESIERKLKFDTLIDVIPNGKPSERYTPEQYALVEAQLKRMLPLHHRMGRMNTFRIWAYLQWLFALAALGVMILVVLRMFGHPLV